MTRRQSKAGSSRHPDERVRDATTAGLQPRNAAREASVEQRALWLRSRKGDAEARRALVEQYLPSARAVAARMYAGRPDGEVEFDDYLQLAHVGLLEAVDRYDPDREVRFTTFATPRIRGAVLSGLERLTERRQQWAVRQRTLKERVSTFVQGSAPCFAAGILDELEEIGVGVALGLILEGTGMVPSGSAAPDHAYLQHELRRVHSHLWEMVKHLTPREREVLEQHYRDGKRFEAIARDLRLTRGRISQLHRQAVLRLRGLVGQQDGIDVAY